MTQHGLHRTKKPFPLRCITQNYVLYIFLLPSLMYLLLFQYAPLYGIQIAFKDFSAGKGVWGSPWVGLKHFERFFSSYLFIDLLVNTLLLSATQLIVSFPFPILLALLLNHTTHRRLGKITQTVTYAPHFISTVVMVGMLLVFLAPSGMVNQLVRLLGGGTVSFMGDAKMFRPIYVWSNVWQQMGWNSVIYIAALSGVSPELHEAAIVDGANKLHRIWYIDLPCLMPTAIILLIMNTGSLLSLGFEKAFLMQNDVNIGYSEIISTYVYKVGLLNARFSYSTAIGLFNNVVNFIILLSVNGIAKKISGISLI